jgi:hypothetical protein
VVPCKGFIQFELDINLKDTLLVDSGLEDADLRYTILEDIEYEAIAHEDIIKDNQLATFERILEDKLELKCRPNSRDKLVLSLLLDIEEHLNQYIQFELSELELIVK